MQLFPCPFCGPRPETEFHYGGEAGKVRPEPAEAVSETAWADYLHAQANPKGVSREVWVHLACGEFFVLSRHTVTHEILGAEAMPGREA